MKKKLKFLLNTILIGVLATVTGSVFAYENPYSGNVTSFPDIFDDNASYVELQDCVENPSDNNTWICYDGFIKGLSSIENDDQLQYLLAICSEIFDREVENVICQLKIAELKNDISLCQQSLYPDKCECLYYTAKDIRTGCSYESSNPDKTVKPRNNLSDNYTKTEQIAYTGDNQNFKAYLSCIEKKLLREYQTFSELRRKESCIKDATQGMPYKDFDELCGLMPDGHQKNCLSFAKSKTEPFSNSLFSMVTITFLLLLMFIIPFRNIKVLNQELYLESAQIVLKIILSITVIIRILITISEGIIYFRGSGIFLETVVWFLFIPFLSAIKESFLVTMTMDILPALFLGLISLSIKKKERATISALVLFLLILTIIDFLHLFVLASL